MNAAKTFTFDFTPVNDTLVTRYSASIANPYFRNLGYTTGEFLNNAASACYAVMPQCDILFISSHGNPGQVTFLYNGGTVRSYMYASKTINTTYDRALSSLSLGQISQIDLLIFDSCYSGATSETQGNLVDIAREKGAFCVIGWNKTIKVGDDENWTEQFIVALYQGNTVQEALEIARSWFEINEPISESITNINTGSSLLDSLVIG